MNLTNFSKTGIAITLLSMSVIASADEAAAAATPNVFSMVWTVACKGMVTDIMKQELLKPIYAKTSSIDNEGVCGCITTKMKANSLIAPIFVEDDTKVNAMLKNDAVRLNYLKGKSYQYTMECTAASLDKVLETLAPTNPM